MVTIEFGKWSLENDVDFKVIPDGFEIFPAAVEKHGINPSDVDTVDGRAASADWGSMGSIMVKNISDPEPRSYGTGDEEFDRVFENSLNGVDPDTLSDDETATQEKYVNDNWDDLNASGDE